MKDCPSIINSYENAWEKNGMQEESQPLNRDDALLSGRDPGINLWITQDCSSSPSRSLWIGSVIQRCIIFCIDDM